MKSEQYTKGFALRVVLKAVVLFVVFNLLFALRDPMPTLGRLSLYNGLMTGRARLPYGTNPASYNLGLMNLDAMFSSHVVAAHKAEDEYRVLLLGDSAVWGFLLEPADTLAGRINAAGYTVSDGRRVCAYNLGYPVMSLTKDLMLLDYAMRYDPDLIVWLVTLESFPRAKQLYPPLVQNNPRVLRRLIADYALDLDPDDARFVTPGFWDGTILGRRRALADLLRLQLYGVAWSATGIDQHYPRTYTPRQEDFEADETFQGLERHTFAASELAFDVLRAGIARAGDVPVLLVNEPMFISDGENSALRYNAFYPRWAYDAYRAQLDAKAEAEGWRWLDLWDALPDGEYYTDSAVHLTPDGSEQLGAWVGSAIVALAEGTD